MKNAKCFLGTVLMASLFFIGCGKSDDGDMLVETPPTAQEFAKLQSDALEDLTQQFQFEAEDGSTTFTSEKGVNITINGSCLKLDGNPVSGSVDVAFVELFDKGHMLVTNKPTMGVLPNGNKKLLISGGEFYIRATQDGEPLDNDCDIILTVPSDLTGGSDPDMVLWNGTIDDDGNLTWEEDPANATGQGGVFVEGGQYYAFLSDFGWSNIDRFYNDPRPKTTIYVQAPTGYDYTNSNIYLSYDGENTGLAALDTYEDGLFSEHYGEIPIGLECHVIFISEDNGNWKYAIKPVTIAADEIITFSLAETAVATEAQLTDLINDLP
ncbi:MAG: hypothetical protein AB3N16_13095 [Flavobacteriaceae bacterium]